MIPWLFPKLRHGPTLDRDVACDQFGIFPLAMLSQLGHCVLLQSGQAELLFSKDIILEQGLLSKHRPLKRPKVAGLLQP